MITVQSHNSSSLSDLYSCPRYFPGGLFMNQEKAQQKGIKFITIFSEGDIHVPGLVLTENTTKMHRGYLNLYKI